MADELHNSAAIAPDTTAAESNDDGASSDAGANGGAGADERSPLAASMAALREHGTPLAEMGDGETGTSNAESSNLNAEGEGAGEGEAGEGEGAGEGTSNAESADLNAEEGEGEGAGEGEAEASEEAGGKEPPLRNWMKGVESKQRAQLIALTRFLTDNPGMSLADAAAELGFTLPAGTPGAEGSKAPEGTSAAEAKAPATVEALRAEIAKLEAEADAAADEYDAPKARKLDKEVAEKKRDLERAVANAAQAQAGAASEYQAGVAASAAKAREAYPDAWVEGTPLYDAVKQEATRLERVNPAAFRDPEWVEAAVAKAAAKLGVLPAKAAANGTKPADGTKAAPNGVKPSVPAKPAPTAPRPPVLKAAGKAATPVSGTAGAAPTPAGIQPPPASAPLKEQMAFLRAQGQQVEHLVRAEA